VRVHTNKHTQKAATARRASTQKRNHTSVRQRPGASAEGQRKGRGWVGREGREWSRWLPASTVTLLPPSSSSSVQSHELSMVPSRGVHGVELTDHMMKSPPSNSRSLSQSGSCVVGVMTVAQDGRVRTTTLHSSGGKCWEEAPRDHGPLLQDHPARYPPRTPL
jgi:hypothetical protein